MGPLFLHAPLEPTPGWPGLAVPVVFTQGNFHPRALPPALPQPSPAPPSGSRVAQAFLQLSSLWPWEKSELMLGGALGPDTRRPDPWLHWLLQNPGWIWGAHLLHAQPSRP